MHTPLAAFTVAAIVLVASPLAISDAIQRIASSAAVRAAGPRAGSPSDVPAYAAGAPGAVTPSGISAGFSASATASCCPANAVDFARLYNRLYMVSQLQN